MKYRNQPTGMWGKQRAKDEDVGVHVLLRLNTLISPQSSNTEMYPFKNQLNMCPKVNHFVFLPRNELGINSTFLQTKNFK